MPDRLVTALANDRNSSPTHVQAVTRVASGIDGRLMSAIGVRALRAMSRRGMQGVVTGVGSRVAECSGGGHRRSACPTGTLCATVEDHQNRWAPQRVIADGAPHQEGLSSMTHQEHTTYSTQPATGNGCSGKKVCSKCRKEKPISMFSAGGSYNYCNPCRVQYNREWRQRNPARSREANRRRNAAAKDRRTRLGLSAADEARIKRYGVTLDDYQLILDRQGGLCAICRQPPKHRKNRHGRLDVDHCHVTGKVRGLLCNRCNVAIGLLFDSPLLAASASVYLMDEPHCGNGPEGAVLVDDVAFHVKRNVFPAAVARAKGRTR